MPMNTVTQLIAVAVLLVAGAATLAADKPGRAEKNEARLTELLKGRTAGTPVSCIPAFQADQFEVIEGVAMVYGRGQTLYVARPSNPQSMRWDDVVVIKRSGGQLCHTDIIRTVDRMSGFTTGVLFLDKFVPYKKQD
jgi:hypothetical protein